MHELFVYLNSIKQLSPNIDEHLSLVLKEKTFLKKEYLLKTNQVCKNIWFIKNGLVRCFYNKNSIEVCSWFMKEGDMVISVESFFKQKAGFENIQALEDTTVYYIEYSQLQEMYHTFPEFNFIGRVLTEKYYTLSEERLFLSECNGHMNVMNTL